jgi:hypothetical protein
MGVSNRFAPRKRVFLTRIKKRSALFFRKTGLLGRIVKVDSRFCGAPFPVVATRACRRSPRVEWPAMFGRHRLQVVAWIAFAAILLPGGTLASPGTHWRDRMRPAPSHWDLCRTVDPDAPTAADKADAPPGNEKASTHCQDCSSCGGGLAVLPAHFAFQSGLTAVRIVVVAPPAGPRDSTVVLAAPPRGPPPPA